MKKIIKKIYKNILIFFFKFIYGNITIEAKNNNFIDKKIIANRFFKKQYIYSFKQGRIFTDCVQNVAAIYNNILSRECSFQHHNNRIVSPIYNPVVKFGTPKIKKNYTGTILSLVQGASGENYFHWMMDILPRIRIFLERYRIRDIKYFYLPNLAESQIDSLRFLKIDKSKIINSRHNKHISADKIIFTSHPWYTKGKFHDQSANLPRWSILWVRNFFLKYRDKFKIKNKIFLDRSDSIYSHCQIINYENLKTFLLSLGFEILKPSKLSFARQIYAFWNAKVIIGAHGAAFTNILFCKPKTKIIEFKPYNHPGKNYQRIARVNSLRYKCIKSKKKYLNHKKGDIFVNIKKLKEILI